MQNPVRRRYFLLPLIATLGIIAGLTTVVAQDANQPWMNKSLSPAERADLVRKQMTLEEKLALSHGNGMANNPSWTMPLTPFTNGGAGYVEGVKRLGIPPLVISDAAYGIRDSGVNGRYATAMPSNLGAASAWDPQSACEYGEVIGSELRAQGFNMTLGGGLNLTREPRNGRTFEYAGEDPLLAGTLVGNMMKCKQAQHVVGDVKHYVMNDQETGRFVVNALRVKLPNTRIEFDSGADLQSAANLAKSSDIAIVFAYQWLAEDMDLPSLSLPDKQDALIERVAAANPRTIVILESGTAVAMPWLDKVAGVVEAWYAGSAGHKALANVLVGDVNPTGKLAITFPKSDSDLPHPIIPPLPKEDQGLPSGNSAKHISAYTIHYDEGPEVGYKWYEAQHKQPLFAFGFGLSYTTFAYSRLSVNSVAKTVTFTVKNTGSRAGTEIAQAHARLPKGSDESFKRLAGWKRVTLAPGESQIVTVALNPRVLQTFNETNNSWNLASGDYDVFVGASSDNTPLTGSFIVR